MKHVFTLTTFLKYARRGALLLALGATAPAAWGQRFGPVTTYSSGVASQPMSVALGDMNADGLLDIVTANANSNTVGVLLGQVGGSFAPVVTYFTNTTSVGGHPLDVVLGDVYGDSRLEIVTANFATNNVGVLQGQVGSSLSLVAYSTGAATNPSGLALGDVNQDGRLDLVTANTTTSTAGVRLGLAAGGFGVATNYPTGITASGSYPPTPTVIVLGDVNGDSRLDMVINNYYQSTVGSTAGILLGLASGGFGTVTEYPTSAQAPSDDLALGDVNGDGRPDVVTVSFYGNGARVLLAQASGFATTSNFYSTGPNSGPKGVALGDVNGDGRPDIVTANFTANTVSVMLGQTGGVFVAPTAYSIGTSSGSTNVALGDVNGDGRLDIITAIATANSVSVLVNTGTYLATARPTTADLALSPNPAHDAFTVQLPAGLVPTSAALLNALGQVVRRPAVGAGSFKVETGGLAPGIYTLRLRAGGAALTRRVVVE